MYVIDKKEDLYKHYYYIHNRVRDNVDIENKIFRQFEWIKTKISKNKREFYAEADEHNAKMLFNYLGYYVDGKSTSGHPQTDPVPLGSHHRWSIYILVSREDMDKLRGVGAQEPGHGLDKEIDLINIWLKEKFGDKIYNVQIFCYDEIENEYKTKTGRDYKFSFNQEQNNQNEVRPIVFLLSPYMNIRKDFRGNNIGSSDGSANTGFTVDLFARDRNNQGIYQEAIGNCKFSKKDGEMFRIGRNWFDDFWLPGWDFSIPVQIINNKVVLGNYLVIDGNVTRNQLDLDSGYKVRIDTVVSGGSCQVLLYTHGSNDYILNMVIKPIGDNAQQIFTPTKQEELNKMAKKYGDKSRSIGYDSGNSIYPDNVYTDNQPDAGNNQEAANPHENVVDQMLLQTHRIIPFLPDEYVSNRIADNPVDVYIGDGGDIEPREQDALVHITVPIGERNVVYIQTKAARGAGWNLTTQKLELVPSYRHNENFGEFSVCIGDFFQNYNEIKNKTRNIFRNGTGGFLGLLVSSDRISSQNRIALQTNHEGILIGRNQVCNLKLYDQGENTWTRSCASDYHALLFYYEGEYHLYNISKGFGIYLFNEKEPRKIEEIPALNQNDQTKRFLQGLKTAPDKRLYIVNAITNSPDLFHSKVLYDSDILIIGSGVFRFAHSGHPVPADIQPLISDIESRATEINKSTAIYLKGQDRLSGSEGKLRNRERIINLINKHINYIVECISKAEELVDVLETEDDRLLFTPNTTLQKNELLSEMVYIEELIDGWNALLEKYRDELHKYEKLPNDRETEQPASGTKETESQEKKKVVRPKVELFGFNNKQQPAGDSGSQSSHNTADQKDTRDSQRAYEQPEVNRSDFKKTQRPAGDSGSQSSHNTGDQKDTRDSQRAYEQPEVNRSDFKKTQQPAGDSGSQESADGQADVKPRDRSPNSHSNESLNSGSSVHGTHRSDSPTGGSRRKETNPDEYLKDTSPSSSAGQKKKMTTEYNQEAKEIKEEVKESEPDKVKQVVVTREELKESNTYPTLSVKLGVHKERHNDVYWQFDRSNNRHCLITGSSGSGKTYFMQCMIYELIRNEIPAVVFDYSKSYTLSQMEKTGFWEVAENNMEVIYVKTDGIAINPFKPFYYTVGDEGMLSVSTNYEIASRISETMKRVYSLNDQQANAITKAVEKGLEDKGQNFDFSDMKSYLRSLPNREANSQTVAAVERKLEDLFRGNPFKTEGRFSWADIINSNGKVKLIQLDGFPTDEFKKLVTEMIIWDAWNFMSVNGNEKTPLVLFLDEAQNLNYGKDSPSYKILTEGRKFGFSGIFAMQFTDYNLSNLVQTAINQAALKVIFNPPSNILRQLSRVLDPTGDYTEAIAKNLQELARGEAVVIKKERDGNGFSYDLIKVSSLNERRVNRKSCKEEPEILVPPEVENPVQPLPPEAENPVQPLMPGEISVRRRFDPDEYLKDTSPSSPTSPTEETPKRRKGLDIDRYLEEN